MTGTGLNDPDEGIREAERRDLEVELKEKPTQDAGRGKRVTSRSRMSTTTTRRLS